MATGKVKWFDPKKGFGFILGDENRDVFVHYTSIAGDGFRALKDGETVEYELVEGEKGLQAKNVAHVDGAGEASGEQESAEQSTPPAQ